MAPIESHAGLRVAVRALCQQFPESYWRELDQQRAYPEAFVRALTEAGYLGALIPREYGGLGMSLVEASIILEEINRSGGNAGPYHAQVYTMGTLLRHGSEAQKQAYLPKIASGELRLQAFGVTEPEAGSDATSQHTTAMDAGDHYVINGTKNWITNGGTASVYLVMAQTDPLKKSRGINTFIVEKNWPGVTVAAKENKLGIRGSDTHSIMFNDVRVPKENQIGENGFGFKFAMRTLAGGRIGIASQALGIASGAYELSLKYSKERKSFGTEIMNHQAIAFKLADMATRIEAARLLCLKAAWEKDQQLDYTVSSSMAKVYASETAMWTTVEAVQIHGGYGFVKEYHVERLMRDAKITQIYEGTSEVQRIVISRAIL